MKDKLYTQKKITMKIYLLILTFGILLFSGCTAKNEGTILDHSVIESSNSDLKNSDFVKENALHDAVRARDIDAVKFLIDQKMQLNSLSKEGYTALHIAVRLDELDIVQLLVESGAIVNSIDIYGDMPLIDATRDNYTEISKFLICNGAKRDVIDRYKMSPLNNSIKNQNFEVSEMLLTDSLEQFCLTEDVAVQETNEVVFVGLYDALIEEFQNDFAVWNAELTKDDLVFRFNNPVALFEHGTSNLRVGFTDILSDFFPRYLKIIEEYKDQIKEVAIEGHTSSEYKMGKTEEEKYQLNKTLSKKRANMVREYTVNKTLKIDYENKEWVQNKINDYGLSSSALILNDDGTENMEASRRVDFRILQIEQ